MSTSDVVPLRRRRSGARPAAPDPARLTADARALAADLAAEIDGEVRFDDGARALYATDGSNYRQLPIGVVVPRHKVDVMAAIDVCRRHGAPVLSRGGGTSLAGQCCNVAVVLDMSKYLHGILELDVPGQRARVLPGTVLDVLRDAAKRRDLTFGPDPSTHNHCTLGGMIGNNSCGVHSVMAGRTAENVHELEVMTYDGLVLRVGPTTPDEREAIVRAGGRRGEIYRRLADLIDRYGDLVRTRYPKIPRRVSGYNLDELLPENGFHVARALVGTESTCVTVLEATVRLVPWPRARTLLVLGFPDIYAAAEAVPAVMAHSPIGLEAVDHHLVQDIHKKGLHERYLRYLPEGRGFLLVEFGADTKEAADARAAEVLSLVKRDGHAPSGKIYDDADQEEKLWKVRESGLGATARIPGEPDTWEGWEDSAVPPSRLAEYLRRLRALFEKYGYDGAFYGHFGQGCLHTRINFDLTSTAGIANYRAFMEEASDLVVSMGGSLSGEHGDGQSRAELLPKMFGPELVQAFREFKAIWDPEGRMNPHKVVDPYRIDENLRLGPDFHPPQPPLSFQYPDDDGDFTRATLRCVGVGECRRAHGGTMCPSYRVTGEEMHSTRGRAHLLFEMMRGNELRGWKDDAVHESLDLCLACKGCKGDCPVNVDMATYKAEFLSHYYQGRLRPLAAYTMGLIHWWARLASRMPRLVNLLTQTPPVAGVLKRLGGIAAEREVPAFAASTFKAAWRRRAPRNPDGAPVILWPDTFNDHFFPETALAAAEVLEAAGYRVVVPEGTLCCGRPLYDWGMIAPARRLLDGVLRALRAPLEAGVPVVALEPSCASVFRDELRNLMPRDPTASRLREQTFLFAEFLNRHAPHLDLPRLERAAVAHGHCHQKALWGGMDEERALFRRMGVEAQVLDSGCCGMAGSFGFERGEKYRVSMRVGEHELFPTLRRTGEETLLVADGFSCREQIRQATPRRALHIAEVARLSLARHAVDPLSVSLPLPVPVLSPAPPAAVAMLAVAAAIGNAHVRRWGRVVTLGALGALGAALTGLAVRARARARARRRERQRGRESSGAASATSAKLEAAVNKQ